jgi:apolipoprotein N-acyltransferase
VAWVALVPLLVALGTQPFSRAALLGLTTGFVYFAGTVYWITRVMVVYGGLSLPVAILVNLALIAYLALFPAIFAMVTARLVAAGGTPMLMSAPLVWVATELGRTRLFTGFPWVLLGYSQVETLPIAQVASLFGVYGVSALVASVSAALAILMLARVGRERTARTPLVVVVATVAVVVVWGSLRIHSGRLVSGGEPVRVGLIQGNVSQDERWGDQRASQIFRDYLTMSQRAADKGATFILWPESAMPFRFAENLASAEVVRGLARGNHATLLFGSDQVDRTGADNRWYNSAYVVGPDGNTRAVYQKIHLVPFGEYVPLKNLFFFASRLVEAVSDFSPGTSATLLPVGDRYASTAICYEVVYPDLVRQFVAGGSQLLTTITNDAWFGETSAPYQHFAQASMRAIENGRYLVRAANTGISGIVDPYGRVLARGGLFAPDVIVGDVRFITETTLYTRTGDLFAYLCTLATLLLLVAAWRRYKAAWRRYKIAPDVQGH